jgi:hypothetical protein
VSGGRQHPRLAMKGTGRKKHAGCFSAPLCLRGNLLRGTVGLGGSLFGRQITQVFTVTEQLRIGVIDALANGIEHGTAVALAVDLFEHVL